ncbi:hypothetical protein [uncultured Psychroserpens sp.]|uniref:tetratricopeptide repeat protein n=1 Tax=uncultured Psychroserpens sp. TaxID=255436 RepID=UPI00260DF2DD|nr:hypothetical protein [uncultured Psychroserpens sp.]
MKRSVLFFLVIFSFVVLSNAQNSNFTDSISQIIPTQKDTTLIKSYLNLGISYQRSNDSLSLLNYTLALKEAKSISNDDFIAQSLFRLAVLNNLKTNYERSFKYLDSALTIYTALNNIPKISQIKSYIGVIESKSGQYEKAISSQMEALKLREANSDLIRPYDIANNYMRIGNLHSIIGNFETATTYLKKAERLFEVEGFDRQVNMARSNIAINFADSGNEADAIPYIKETIAYFESKSDKSSLMDDYMNLGQMYFEIDSIEQAEVNFVKSLNLSKELGSKLATIINERNLGNVLLKRNRLNESLEYNKRSLESALDIDNKTQLMYSFLSMSDVYKAKNDYKNAYDFRVLYQHLSDSLYSVENVEKINDLEIKYQTEKKEQEIINQKNEIELLNVKGKVNNLQRLLLAFGLLLALLGLYALYQRNKRNKLAKEKVMADLEFKTKELTTHALHLAKKNEVLNDLKQKAKVLKQDADADPGYQMLIQTINFDLQDDNNWENFSKYFEEVHKDFNAKAQEQFPNITSNDLRLMALLKMNLSSKEIANILNISSDGIKKARQRLRKKMGLDSSESLEAIVIAI